MKFWLLDFYCDIQIISFISPSVGGTAIYCGGSLVEKIITCVYFVMQSAYYLYFRSGHDMCHNRYGVWI